VSPDRVEHVGYYCRIIIEINGLPRMFQFVEIQWSEVDEKLAVLCNVSGFLVFSSTQTHFFSF
jgi:hypothetical protein